ncbi:hypothetical protein NHQ30_002883 [Ciborinia camelliae]|nr:hypothetical protein NHQ30_002883 [Ciborinia camelliae]
MVMNYDRCSCNGWSNNVDRGDDDTTITAVTTPQTSDQRLSPDTISNEVTPLHNPPATSLAMDKEGNLHGSSPPHHFGGKLEGMPDNRQMSAISRSVSHFFSAGREEEKEEVDIYGSSPPRRTNVKVESDRNSRRTSATSENEEEVKKEELEDLYGASPLRRAGSQVKFEKDSYGASTNSSISSNGLTPQFTPSTSLADDNGADVIEEDLIDLSRKDSPHHAGDNFRSSQSNHRTLLTSFMKQNSSTQMKLLAAARHVHQTPSPVIISTTPPSIPKHEVFLHTLPPKDASVVQVRAWIASWFIGREISFEIPWKGMDIGLKPYIDCISWSGDDLHGARLSSLEMDLRGWMLGGYARPIVRDIEKARDVERDKKWKAFARRFADFVWGVVFMAVVGLVLMNLMPCLCGNY